MKESKHGFMNLSIHYLVLLLLNPISGHICTHTGKTQKTHEQVTCQLQSTERNTQDSNFQSLSTIDLPARCTGDRQ